jgi:pyruvate dehydrogenase phosphatase
MENETQYTAVTPKDLTFHFLEGITNHFSEEHIIGSGGYGVVYKV